MSSPGFRGWERSGMALGAAVDPRWGGLRPPEAKGVS
jgi:hypothetical protein